MEKELKPANKELTKTEARIQSRIEELLPNYYEKMGDNPRYRTIDLFKIHGHEVAWMEYTGHVEVDLTGGGREGEEFKGRSLDCEGDFKEGIGWKFEDGHKYSLDHGHNCPAKERVIEDRQLELKQEYLGRFIDHEKPELKDHLEEILFDLIQKKKEGQLLEVNTGAGFWGGYFYVQTFMNITGLDWTEAWNFVNRLRREKKIDLEGAVIQEYTTPPPPVWKEYARMEKNGYTAIAYLPTHSKMDQKWGVQLIGPDGTMLEPGMGPNLTQIPTFGPDVEDVKEVGIALEKILEGAKRALPSKKPPLQIAPPKEG